MASGPRMVNKQFNSPIGLYSQQNIQDTLSKQTKVLNNGAVGIDFNAKPSNLANSAVLRMLEEEEQRQRNGQAARYSRGDRQRDPHIRRIDRHIDWPPKSAKNDGGQINMNNMYSAQFFKPRTAGTKRIAWPPPAEEGEGLEGESESPAKRQAVPAPVKLFQSPALSRLIPFERESAPVSHNPPQARVYAPQAPAAQVSQVQPQLSPLPKAFSPQPPLSPQTQTFPPPFPEPYSTFPEPYSTFPRKSQSSFAPVSPRAFAPLSPQAHEPRSLSAVTSQVYSPIPPPSRDFSLVSPQPYHSPVSAPSAPFKFGATRDEQPGAPSTYIIPIQFEEPPPSTVTLRPSAPVHQIPAPVVASQPAANSFKGGVNMRGDQKWPPASNKEAMQAENEARISLAKGPACRPRKVKKDYSSFFAKNALPNNYPGYKVPPGTQHYDDASGTSHF